MQKGTEGHLLLRAFSYVPIVLLIELRIMHGVCSMRL